MILIKRLFYSLLFLWSVISCAQEINPNEVRNLDINSIYAEIGVKFIQNGRVLFASSKKGTERKKRDGRDNRHMGLRLYTGKTTIDGSIIDAKPFSAIKNNPILELNITFSSDFKTVYFTRNNYIVDGYAKFFRKDTVNYHILKIFKASINDTGELSNIKSLPINSSSYSVTNPYLSPDNKKLYFISDMKSSYGGFDIYEIDIFSDGTYGTPKNLGNKINSSKNEMFPFIGIDNILYFSSDRKGGFGKLDVYKVSLNNPTSKNPINLDAPINSKKDDFSFSYNASKNIGYISSTRREGVGDADIYAFNLNKKNIDKTIVKDSTKSIALLKLNGSEECVQIVEGYILNSKNTILENASVTLYENGQNIGTFDLLPDGKYLFELKCNRHYRVMAHLNKFEESYFEIRTTRFTGSKTTTNIILDKIPCDVLIAGQLKDINTNKSIAGAKIYLVNNNSQIDATYTDFSGKYTFTVDCDEDYQIATDKFGYEDGLFKVEKSLIDKTTITINSKISPIECSQIVRGRINNSVTGIPIINANIRLQNEKSEIIETVKSNSNGNFHFNIKCEQAYKILVSNLDFISKTSNFKSTDTDKQNHRIDFALTPNACLQTIIGNVINSRTKGIMANITVELLQDNEVVKSIITTSTGTFEFEVDCNENYTISATTKDYSIDSKTITTNKTHQNNIEVSLVLDTKLDFELVRDELMILTEHIDFDLNQSSIRDDAEIELNKVVSIMTKNPVIKVNIGVHMDSRAPDNYNLTLSEERAQSILDFLISKGINTNRLTGKGYGETQLLNECANGIPCTETQHLVNRRVEFIVIK